MPKRLGRLREAPLFGPELDAGSPATGQVPVAELDLANHPRVPGKIDDPRRRAWTENQPGLGLEGLAVAEGHAHLEELDDAAFDLDHDAAKAPIARADLDDVAVDAPVDRTLAES